MISKETLEEIKYYSEHPIDLNDRKQEYLKIIKEQGEFDFEVSAMVEELTQEEYEELKSMLITAIGTMEEMRRYKIYTGVRNDSKRNV